MSQPTQVGPYHVVRTLGQGGMGVVYEVRHPERGAQRLALKLLLSSAPPRELLARFEREAEILGKINHPNIVSVVDFSRTPDGKPYLVCDFVAGKTLRDLCMDDPMEPEQAARIARDLADALSQIHRRGIVHRDLKPENVMVSAEGDPMLLDFGLARELDAERLTVTGSILGTPAYMAPEQAEGDKRTDARTDVYGLGATLFFLLCGYPPFRGKQPMAVLRQVIMEDPRWPTREDRLEQQRRREAAPEPAPLPPVFNQEATAWGAEGPGGFQGDRTQLYPIGSLPGTPGGSDTTQLPTVLGFQDDATHYSLPGAPSGFGSQPGAAPAGFGHPGAAPTGFGSQPGPATGFGGQPGPATGFGSQPGVAPTGFGNHPGANPTGFGSQPGPATGFGSQPGLPSTFGASPTGGASAEDWGAIQRRDLEAAERAASTVLHAPIDANLPMALVAICKVAMSKAPADRYPSAAALRDDLDSFLSSGSAAAGATLRAQGWRRRLPWVLLALAALGGALGAGYALRGASTPTPSPRGTVSPSDTSAPSPTHPPATPARTPTPRPRVTPSPTPDFGPRPASLQVAAEALPVLGSDAFPAALRAARHHFPDAGLLARLAKARADLEALRDARTSKERESLAARWRREHGELPRAHRGPVAIELPPRRFWHSEAASKRRPPAKALIQRRRNFGAQVAWADPEGTRLAVADSFELAVYDVSGGSPRRVSAHPLRGKSEWAITSGIAADPARGAVYLSGSTFHVQDGRLVQNRRWPAILTLSEGKVGIGSIQQGIQSETDRFISIAISPGGRSLALGTERGEVAILPVGEGRGGQILLANPQAATDTLSLSFLSEEALLVLCAKKEEDCYLVHLDLTTTPATRVATLDLGDVGQDTPTLTLAVGGEHLLGQVGGRLSRLSGRGESLEVLERQNPYALPPAAGVYARTAWGSLAFVGGGQVMIDKRPEDQEQGGLLRAWRTTPQLESLATHRLLDPLDGFLSLSLSPDGRRLAAGTLQGHVLIWELE